MPTKVCRTCGAPLVLGENWSEYMRDQAVAGMRWYYQCLTCRKPFTAESVRRSNLKLKNEVFEHYGGKCSCCGEANSVFLTIDHTKDDGAAHRKAKGTSGVFRDIRRRGYPSDYRILCYNCNNGRRINGGICPHEELK
jgi:hypothetical protein